MKKHKKNLVWITDIHLDHCEENVIHDFCRSILDMDAQAVLLTGDIAESHNIASYLEKMAVLMQIPIYFILGNHDYYHGSIAEVRHHMKHFNGTTHLSWMPVCGVVQLTEHIGLVGHDGWSDGRHGDFYGSHVRLTDYRLIQELIEADNLLETLQSLGDESASYFLRILPEAFENYAHIYLLMHPPPFKEACWYLGGVSADENWQPHFTCKAVGDVLLAIMRERPDCTLTVLAGHTHNGCDVSILPNLRVMVGEARYGAPRINGVFSVR